MYIHIASHPIYNFDKIIRLCECEVIANIGISLVIDFHNLSERYQEKCTLPPANIISRTFMIV